jgi:HEAT repeat protein
VARNFAAYVIGMIGGIQAQDALAEALQSDKGVDVSRYCITSLGKLRSRRHLPLLVQFFQTGNDDLRLVISQAVSNIVGIAHYEL